MPVQEIRIPAVKKMTANLHTRCEETTKALWGRILRMNWEDLSQKADAGAHDITVDVYLPMALRPNGTFYTGRFALIGDVPGLLDLFDERRAVSIKNAHGDRRARLFRVALAEHWYRTFGRRVATWFLGERPLFALNDEELNAVAKMLSLAPIYAEELSDAWRAHQVAHGAREQVFSPEAVERERKLREDEAAHARMERAMARRSSPLVRIEKTSAEKATEASPPLDLLDLIAASGRP